MNLTRKTGRTPANVAQHATETDVLPKGEPALVGLFGSKGKMRALLRYPGGRIVKLEPGSRVGWGRVVGIDSDGVAIQKGGRLQRLRMGAANPGLTPAGQRSKPAP